jgi:hypothetical protein
MASPDPEVIVNVTGDNEDKDDVVLNHVGDIDIEFDRRGPGDWRLHAARGLNLKREPFNSNDDGKIIFLILKYVPNLEDGMSKKIFWPLQLVYLALPAHSIQVSLQSSDNP